MPTLSPPNFGFTENCNLARAIAENRISRSVLEPDPNKRKRRLSDFSDTPSGGDGDDASNASPQKKLTKKAARALEVQERKRVRLEKKARKELEAAEARGRRKKGECEDIGYRRLRVHFADIYPYSLICTQVNRWTSTDNVE